MPAQAIGAPVTGHDAGRTLVLAPRPVAVAGDDIAVILDAAWTPGPGTGANGRLVPVRDAVDALLRRFDPIAETAALLDAWAAASGVVEILTIGGTSFWYYVRLRHWLWLQERVLWAQLLRHLVDEHRPAALRILSGADPALVEVGRLMAAADGLALVVDAADGPAEAALPGAEGARPAGHPGDRPSVLRRVAARARRALARARPRSRAAGERGPHGRTVPGPVLDRLRALAAEPERRLLVVSTHAPHRVETPDGPRMMNPYLGSVADRLRGTPLDPVVLDWRARWADPAGRDRVTGPGTERTLPQDAYLVDDARIDPAVTRRAAAAAGTILDIREPVLTAGIDLGPSLARNVGETAARWFPPMHQTVARIGRLLAYLHPAGILVADEYHRQDWGEAARAAGIPFAAVQHGTISRHHRGYIHAARPPQLKLPDRTYLFGQWERDRLVRDSVYRDAEVVVSGSPRLDLFEAVAVDRDVVRTELGVSPGDRLLVLSGTWGEIYRRFHYPSVLARLFDRPLPAVHLVVKQHPAEVDEGPYRAVVEGVAAARGFSPPPITVVKDVDLYRLLGAADAHLGVHSTVLTEAVFVGTPNLLATGVLGGDLLDYVQAGVALPVADGGDLLAALDAAAAGAVTAEARAAFIAAHYEPGAATDRIAADLLGWLR